MSWETISETLITMPRDPNQSYTLVGIIPTDIKVSEIVDFQAIETKASDIMIRALVSTYDFCYHSISELFIEEW